MLWLWAERLEGRSWTLDIFVSGGNKQGTVEGINKPCSSTLLVSHNVYKSFVLDDVVDKFVDIVVVAVLATASLLNLSGGMSSIKSCGSSAGSELLTIIYN